jgi:aminoglycoside phosphotransferase family enzyme/predicted kinase
VVPITGSVEHPLMGGEGVPLEFAVKMRQFPQQNLLNRLIENGRLTATLVDCIAHRVARFHAGIEIAGSDSPYGTPAEVLSPMLQNFSTIRAHLSSDKLLKPLDFLEDWTQSRFHRLEAILRQRKEQGFIRECHGDMHLGNIALVDEKICIFDGIEFNEHIRWIDVISELAFLVMDLDDRNAPRLAQRVLNHYLQDTGDYSGLALLRFYQVYRAMVKAKVNAIRLSQGHLTHEQNQDLVGLYRSYVQLASSYTAAQSPMILMTNGLSGCGKSTLCQRLAEETNIIWIRSDVERKRLYGLGALERSHSDVQRGLYSITASERTYARLLSLARQITEAGFTVLVDATFLKTTQRQHFSELADTLGFPWHILSLQASEDTLKRRIKLRSTQRADPSEATLEVLNLQLRACEPLGDRELEHSFKINAEETFPIDSIKKWLN